MEMRRASKRKQLETALKCSHAACAQLNTEMMKFLFLKHEFSKPAKLPQGSMEIRRAAIRERPQTALKCRHPACAQLNTEIM